MKLYYIIDTNPNPYITQLSDEMVDNFYKAYGDGQGYLSPGFVLDEIKFPQVTLSNGLKVVNFSSNHSAFSKSNVAFTFEDGTQLINVDMELNKLLSMREVNDSHDNGKFTVVQKGYRLTASITNAIEYLQKQYVDIIIVPFPMLIELNKAGIDNKCYTCELNRQTKVCSINRFCSL